MDRAKAYFLACGLPVISDYSEVLEKMFGDAILCYRDEEEFAVGVIASCAS